MKKAVRLFVSACALSIAICCLAAMVAGYKNKIAALSQIESTDSFSSEAYACTDNDSHVFISINDYITFITGMSNNALHQIEEQRGYYLLEGLPDDAVLDTIEVSNGDCVFTYSVAREPNISIEPDEEQLINMFTKIRRKVFQGRSDSNPTAFAQSLANAIGATYYADKDLYSGAVYADIGYSTGRIERLLVGRQTVTLNSQGLVEYSYIPLNVTETEAENIFTQYILINSDISE